MLKSTSHTHTHPQAIFGQARRGDHAPLIPHIPRTKLPNFTPALAAYITSGPAIKSGKPAQPQHLLKPPSLPERADPESEEARLLGRLSKRREANIRWRHLTGFRSRVSAPMKADEEERLARLVKTARAGPPASDGTKKAKGGVGSKARKGGLLPPAGYKTDPGRNITDRFLRRRYQEILDAGTMMERGTDQDGMERWAAKHAKTHSSETRRFGATAEDERWIQGG